MGEPGFALKDAFIGCIRSPLHLLADAGQRGLAGLILVRSLNWSGWLLVGETFVARMDVLVVAGVEDRARERVLYLLNVLATNGALSEVGVVFRGVGCFMWCLVLCLLLFAVDSVAKKAICRRAWAVIERVAVHVAWSRCWADEVSLGVSEHFFARKVSIKDVHT